MTPAITWLDDETARVVVDEPQAVTIDFARISETARADAVVAVVTIETEVAELGWVAGPVRVNLLSTSAIDQLRRTCNRQTDVVDWARLLGSSIKAVLDGLWNATESTDVDLDSEIPAPSWLAKPLLEAEGYTVLYARGGSGKSLLAAACAVTVVSGEPILGVETERIGPVAYLDWESTAETLTWRVRQICRGIGLGTLPYPVRHWRMAGALAARRAAISPGISELEPALIIIDSKGLATTGAPESSEGILDLARAMRHFSTPVLLIDHISKGAITGEGPDMAFGSQYVEASARLAWSLRTDATAGGLQLHLRNTKANNHRRSRDLHLAATFSEDRVVFTTEARPEPVSEAPDSVPEAILDHLLVAGGATTAELAEATGASDATVRSALKRLRDRDEIESAGGLHSLTPATF